VSACTEPRFRDLGTSWRWLVSFTPLPLYPRKMSTRHPLDRRLGGAQSRYGRILDPTESGTPTPVTIPTALSDTGCFKKSFTALKAYINLFRRHAQRFELS
jgi:hypothetical protein